VSLVLAGAAPDRFRAITGVILAGRVRDEELRALYAAATALVIPSLEEGFGLPAAEAMAAGCPVVASDIDVLREVTGGAARLFDPRSIESMASAMLEVIDNTDLREAMKRRGEVRVEGWKWRRVAAETLGVYRLAAKRG
jgi:glycosyltransferase involved in cell wall biosynthesis